MLFPLSAITLKVSSDWQDRGAGSEDQKAGLQGRAEGSADVRVVSLEEEPLHPPSPCGLRTVPLPSSVGRRQAWWLLTAPVASSIGRHDLCLARRS